MSTNVDTASKLTRSSHIYTITAVPSVVQFAYITNQNDVHDLREAMPLQTLYITLAAWQILDYTLLQYCIHFSL